MALAIDGYAVLGCIGAHPDAFANIRADATKAAQALVLAQIKAKAADLAVLRAVHRALGADPFALIVEALKDAQVKTLAAKFDRHNAEIKTASSQQRRRHLCALAEATAEPMQKQPRGRKTAVKSKRKPKSASPEAERLSSEAMSARRDRR